MQSRDFSWLLRQEELVSNIYVLKPDSGSLVAEHPSSELLPWPVALLLGSYSRKHVFGPRAWSRLAVGQFGCF